MSQGERWEASALIYQDEGMMTSRIIPTRYLGRCRKAYPLLAWVVVIVVVVLIYV
jgi:hypothetical protein